MMSFLKTFGKGILYFLGLPFLVVFLILYGFYLFVIFVIYFMKMIVYYFKGKSFSFKDEMDEKAFDILRKKKKENLDKEIAQSASTNITNNFINIDKDLLNSMKNSGVLEGNSKNLKENEPPLIDVSKDNEDIN